MSGTVVLSTLEFDVAWEGERLARRNVALDNVQDCGSDELTPRWVDNVGETSDPVGLCSAPN